MLEASEVAPGEFIARHLRLYKFGLTAHTTFVYSFDQLGCEVPLRCSVPNRHKATSLTMTEGFLGCKGTLLYKL
jgi:hypothetical protein